MATHLDNHSQDGSDGVGLITLSGIIFGLLLVGLLLFSLTWALARQ